MKGPRQYRLFSLSGFDVKIDLSWFLLAMLIAWSLGAGHFPVEYPGLTKQSYAWMGIACAIGVFISIVLHEFSHSIVARQFGIPIKGITLFIFGGIAEMEREPPSPLSEFLMAVAGPAASFVLAVIFYQVEGFAGARAWPVSVSGVFGTLADINVIVAIFNMFPAFPLDGGRMLRAVLWNWRGDIRFATRITSRIGTAFGLFLIVLGVFSVIQGDFIGGMWRVLIGLFLRGAAAAAYQHLILQDLLQAQPVSNFMRRNIVTVTGSQSIEHLIDNIVLKHHFKLYPVVENSRLVGAISIDDIREVPKADRSSTTVGHVMQPVSADNSIDSTTETMTLLSTMLRAGQPSRYMVVDKGDLAGMISLKDLLELIEIKMKIEKSSE